MGLGTAYSLGLSRRAQVAQRGTGGLQGKCMRGAVEEQGAGREVAGIRTGVMPRDRRGSEKSGIESEGVAVEVRACESGTRWTGLSAGRPGYWYVK